MSTSLLAPSARIIKKNPQPVHLFPVKKEYTRCVRAIKRANMLSNLSKPKTIGVIGIDGEEYPIPSLKQVTLLFDQNRELVRKKMSQGFDRLELTPLAIQEPLLISQLKTAILKQGAQGTIHQTRKSPSDPLIPLRVNSEKQVWVWETLLQVIDAEELVFFPQEYSSNHMGQTKLEIINNGNICAVPGWSIGLVENLRVMPEKGEGITLGGRKQLEIGLSPREYLELLQTPAYIGETGKTLEDFITKFLTHLVTTTEVCHDRNDNNALWFLGLYVKYRDDLKSDFVPTGWWHREYGRVRLDAHRPDNKLCTKSWGGASVVRLPKV
ncbi:MAG: hypothetical protein JEZ06_21980 [Anaerolineaceae bacterium]|nr:hypothetical protein [Anaerolineaceae bacterium]